MSSTLYNAAALSALQSLNMTQQSLNTVQNQVSSGLAVATAADNSSYWSIATQLNNDSGIVTAANTSLTQGQALLATASSAINSVITTLNSMATALTEAQNPGANISNVNTSLASLGLQLTDAVNGASFNGNNVLNGSTTAAMNFVSGFNANASGGTVNTIQFTAVSLYGGLGSTTTTAQSTMTDATQIAGIKALVPNTVTVGPGQSSITASTAGPNAITVVSQDLYGNQTSTTYTALDANGNNSSNSAVTVATAAAFAVSTTVTTAATTQLLKQGTIDLTNVQIGTGGVTGATALTAVNSALSAITNYAATIGATQDRMTAANTFNTALTTNYASGVSGLVDANMNTASTQLQALQTQEQLGIQSLSIANQNSQLILKLFQ